MSSVPRRPCQRQRSISRKTRTTPQQAYPWHPEDPGTSLKGSWSKCFCRRPRVAEDLHHGPAWILALGHLGLGQGLVSRSWSKAPAGPNSPGDERTSSSSLKRTSIPNTEGLKIRKRREPQACQRCPSFEVAIATGRRRKAKSSSTGFLLYKPIQAGRSQAEVLEKLS